jgi:hypothetical protein
MLVKKIKIFKKNVFLMICIFCSIDKIIIDKIILSKYVLEIFF